MLASIAIMLTYSLWLFLVVLLSTFAMSFVLKKIGGNSAKYMVSQQTSLAVEEGFVEEMMKGQKVVKVFTHEERAKEDFDKLNEKLFTDSARAHGIWRYLSSTQNLVFDANVKVTRANGGDEFVTSDPVVHGSRTGRVHFSNGLLIQWGVEAITPVSNTPTAKAVTFPVSYTSIPMVLTTAITTVPGTSVSGSASANITVTGFDAYVTRNGTTNTSVGWIAIGYKG
jgi:ABC-type multidrug transport system fused ATPase/permease subunit